MAKAEDYSKLKNKIDQLGETFKHEPQVIFYLVVPPAAVPQIIDCLGEAGLNKPNVKLLLEKPFGSDLQSAKEIITDTQKYFKDDQTYRIDHYLAKGMAQNIAVFLGSNALFRNIWNNRWHSTNKPVR
jgi:glucose-6-phosphate 1-dehydrogenase